MDSLTTLLYQLSEMIGLSPRWVITLILIAVLLILDLGVLNRSNQAISFGKALRGYALWLLVAFVFNIGIYTYLGKGPALEFLAGYLVEQSLSVDNLFIFLVVFRHFSVPPQYQRRVLFYGILGALIMRAVFIFAGSALLARFHWMTYVLGAVLAFGAYKIIRGTEPDIDPEHNPVLRFITRFLPITDKYHAENFFIRENGKLLATPLFLVLMSLEITDLMFAVDSVPAIFAITQDTYIVFTSNIFAILGLRSLFFVVSGAVDRLAYLNYGLAAILFFVAMKMLMSGFVHVPIGLSLSIIGTILVTTVVLSLMHKAKA